VNSMSQSFSTDMVPVSNRLEAWQCNARQICGDCRFEFPKRSPFHGSFERRSLGGVELTQFTSSPVSFAKLPMVNATSQDRACVVITQLQGARSYCQDQRVSVLHPGDTTTVDSGSPWSSQCSGRCTRLYLRFPRWLVQDRLRTSVLPVLPRISGASGLGATLFRLATSLYEQAAVLTPEQGIAAIEGYLDILSGCIGSPGTMGAPGERLGLSARIEDLIQHHLSEPTLNPTEIAAAAGISVRHLQRLFAAKGCTVAEWIREQRLQRCRMDLADPRLSQRNITEIAFYWGFSDSAHFSRCFKEKFGVSPRTFRSHDWRNSWKTDQPRPEPDPLFRGVSWPSQPN
jgi:AraC-like DNA-binding protein